MPKEYRFQAVYNTVPEDWEAICRQHRLILDQQVRPSDAILEVGCGWGRLLDLMPDRWKGVYTGIDLSPEFITLARLERNGPGRDFICGRAEAVLSRFADKTFDLGVCVSIKAMLKANGQYKVWDRIEQDMKKCCKNVLILEYEADGLGVML